MVGDAEYAAYQKLASMGFRLTVEQLMNGIVSQCIEDPELGDFDSVLTQNNEQVKIQLSKMLLRFNCTTAEEWRNNMLDSQ